MTRNKVLTTPDGHRINQNAAPDLFDALMGLLNRHDDDRGEGLSDLWPREAAAARKAIAKALAAPAGLSAWQPDVTLSTAWYADEDDSVDIIFESPHGRV